MDYRHLSTSAAPKNEMSNLKDETQNPEKKEATLKDLVTIRNNELSEIRKKLHQCSEIITKSENLTYCSMDGLNSGLPLVPDEQGIVNNAGESVPNDVVMQKFGQDFSPESVIPGFYTWFQGDGSVVRYVIDFVLYTSRGDRFVPLEHLGRYESRILMFCKVKHIGLVHTVEDLLETNHPWTKSFKTKRRIDGVEGFIKVARKQRYFAAKIVLVDWFFDVGTKEDSPPYLWVVSENDVFYRIDRPSGGYYNAFAPAKLLFDMSTRIVKEMQSENDKSFKNVLMSMTNPKPPRNYGRSLSNYAPVNTVGTHFANNQPNSHSQDTGTDNLAPASQLNGKTENSQVSAFEEKKEDLTQWGAPVNILGCTPIDVYRNLDFIFTECRYYYYFTNSRKLETYLSELVDRLREQSPFHYFDNNFMRLDYVGKNTLANRYKSQLYVKGTPIPSLAHLQAQQGLMKSVKRGPKNKRFNLEEYNNQYNMNDMKSRSGRVIRNKAVSEIEPVVRKHVVQTESQKREEYRKAVELEAKCDGLLLPFDFEWSNYNTCSEASDTDKSPPVLSNDVDIALNNAKYYPRDIPLRTLKFYGIDEIVDLLDLTRQFSVPSLSTPPLLPKMTFVQLESNLVFNTSLAEYKPNEGFSFPLTEPICICNNKRFMNAFSKVNPANATVNSVNNGVVEDDKEEAMDDEEYDDGLQWIYYLNKNLINEVDIEYLEDLDEGSVGRLYVGLMQVFRRNICNYGFDWFVQNLRESGELSDKKKEVQERELQVAISDSELALDFVNTNGGCLYKGRFKRVGQDPDSVLPYVNSSRWNKRFKKFQRVVTVSSTYRYTVISHEQDRDSFTLYDSSRPKVCPLDLLYGVDSNFKTIMTPGEPLPTFKKIVNVWKKDHPQHLKANNALTKSVNHFINGLNSFVNSQRKSGLVVEDLDLTKYDMSYYSGYLVDESEDLYREPVLGFGYKEHSSIAQTELLLEPEMLTEYTWNAFLKVYLFYALYSSKTTYRYKLNSVVWGDPSFLNFSQSYSQFNKQYGDDFKGFVDRVSDIGGEFGEGFGKEMGEDKFDEMIDTENLNMLDDMPFEDYENSNSGVEDDNLQMDNNKLYQEEDEEEEEEEEEDKERSTRRGWGLNRYCPYYEFEMEWHPDQERFETLCKGSIAPSFVKAAFLKLRNKTFLQLDMYERLSLLVWLGAILSYSNVGKNFIDDRNEEFFLLKSQLMKTEDEKKIVKRPKVISRELMELEERYLQRPVLLGLDRFYNSYYYFGLDYERRIYVQTMPQLRFIQNRIIRRSKYLRKPSINPKFFTFDLSEFAQKFTQDRIFNQIKGKRGRKRESSTQQQDDNSNNNNPKRNKPNPPNTQTKITNLLTLDAKENVSNKKSSNNNSNNTDNPADNVDNDTTYNDSSINTPDRLVSDTASNDTTNRDDANGNPANTSDSGDKETGENVKEEMMRKKRSKGRTRNRPKVRRSRQVFDRHPTYFGTVEEYLEYLANAPAVLSWCVIDSHKSLKRFITRLSQHTTNERNLAFKLMQIEPDFSLPSFEILTYKSPTILGEMLLPLLRGVYRFFKNSFTKIVLSTTILSSATTVNDAGSSRNSYAQNEKIKVRMDEVYNNGLYLNLYVNHMIKKCLAFCVSDLEGCRQCLKQILELVYLFEFVTNRYYNHTKWLEMRNEWRLNLEAIYTQLNTESPNLRRFLNQKVKPQGEHKPNCYANSPNSQDNNMGNELMMMVEKAGLWFRFFEVYSYDPSLDFSVSTAVNYNKFVDEHGDLLNSALSEPDKIDIFELLNSLKVNDTMVFFSGGLLELIGSVSDLLKDIQESLGIRVNEEKHTNKTSKSSKTKKKRKKRDRDADSDVNLTDIESLTDPNDLYQLYDIDDAEQTNISKDDNSTKSSSRKSSKKSQTPPETNTNTADATIENNPTDINNNLNNTSDNKTDTADNTHTTDTAADNTVTTVNPVNNVKEEKVEKTPKPKRAKKSKSPNGDSSSNNEVNQETDSVLSDTSPVNNSVTPETTNNTVKEENQENATPKEESVSDDNEELIEQIKLLLAKLEHNYRNAPQETCQVRILSLTTNLIDLQLPANLSNSPPTTKNTVNDNSNAVGDSDLVKEVKDEKVSDSFSQMKIFCLNLTVESLAYDEDSDGEEEDLDEKFGLVKNLRRVCRTMSRIEKTRATKKVTEEPTFTPRPNSASPSQVFNLTLPILLKYPKHLHLPNFMYSYQRVYDGLKSLWRASLKCRNKYTGQTGVIKRSNYATVDVWKCVQVEWNDNKKEQKSYNPWELIL